MPPQEPSAGPAGEPEVQKHLWLWVGIAFIFVVGLFVGIGLAHGNSDYVCSAAVSDTSQGACTGGSWSAWTTVNGVSTRTYTGMKSTTSFSGQVKGVSCSHPSYSKTQAQGTITTEYTACQIVESGTAPTTAGNSSGTAPSSFTTAESDGAVTASSTSSGSYNDYLSSAQLAAQKVADAALATSTISADPVLLAPNSTTRVSWAAAHVDSCTVVGTNGDSWTGIQSPAGGEMSSTITKQTVYTITCTTAIGTQTPSESVTVNVAPSFQEL